MLIICCHTTQRQIWLPSIMVLNVELLPCGGQLYDSYELALVVRILQRRTNGLAAVAESRPAFVLSHEERRHGATIGSLFIGSCPGIYGVPFVAISEFAVIVSWNYLVKFPGFDCNSLLNWVGLQLGKYKNKIWVLLLS